MAVLNFGDVQVPLYTTQVSSPTLKVMDSKGMLYYIPLISEGGCIATGTKELYYEETEINTCKTLTLPAGCYRIELQGGFGGGQCNAGDDADQMGAVASYNLRIQEPMEISLFRGGDGNSAEIKSGYGIGGSASGLDSFVVMGDEFVVAAGGDGEKCAGVPAGYNVSSANAGCSVSGSYGGSGSLNTTNSNALGSSGQAWCSTGGTSIQEIKTYRAPSGGGAIGGAAGTVRAMADTNAVYNLTQTDGTSASGGMGGGMSLTVGDTTFSASGGNGGATVSYSCGGRTAYSYGGGGGGAVCYHVVDTTNAGCFGGTDGASGSTNTSSTSYIKIYRL